MLLLWNCRRRSWAVRSGGSLGFACAAIDEAHVVGAEHLLKAVNEVAIGDDLEPVRAKRDQPPAIVHVQQDLD